MGSGSQNRLITSNLARRRERSPIANDLASTGCQVLRTPVRVGAAGRPTSQENCKKEPMTTPAPTVTDHADFERQLLELRKREKAHTREGDAIAAARRRLPMTEVPPDTTVIGPDGPVPFGDVFEGRDELVVYSHMFYDGQPWEWQCEGCTRNTWSMGDAADAAYLNANGITFAILGDGPYEEIAAFRDFMGYTAPGTPTPTSTTPPWASPAGSPVTSGGRTRYT
jgi:hypothetical protein